MCLCRRLLFCGLWCASSALQAGASGPAEDPDAWLEAEDGLPGLEVNEGELEFLTRPPRRRVLQTRNWLTISASSLEDGWVELRQCQGDLDPVDRVEIVYHYRAMRKLRILSSRGVDRARVEQGTVQLEQVHAGAEVCIAADVRILEPAGEGRFVLQSGPFHRRFLDGYYPVHLEYRVIWEPGLLGLDDIQPAGQPGFDVTLAGNEVRVDTLFEGRLTIRLGWRRVLLNLFLL
jgi:hypothetical protein